MRLQQYVPRVMTKDLGTHGGAHDAEASLHDVEVPRRLAVFHRTLALSRRGSHRALPSVSLSSRGCNLNGKNDNRNTNSFFIILFHSLQAVREGRLGSLSPGCKKRAGNKMKARRFCRKNCIYCLSCGASTFVVWRGGEGRGGDGITPLGGSILPLQVQLTEKQ